MASFEIVTMTDDLDSNITEGVQTFTFFDPETGDKVEIELGEKNAKALSKAIAGLEKFLVVGRVVKAPEPVTKPAAKANGQNAVIRAWAQANGFAIGDRGRIKAEIVSAFEAAHAQAVTNTQDRADATGLETSAEVVCPDGKPGCEVLHLAPEQESVTDGIVDADDLAEVEFPQDAPLEEWEQELLNDKVRPATEDELQEMLLEMAKNGQEPTADDLIIAE